MESAMLERAKRAAVRIVAAIPASAAIINALLPNAPPLANVLMQIPAHRMPAPTQGHAAQAAPTLQ